MELAVEKRRAIIEQNIDVLDRAAYDAEIAIEVSGECGESDAMTKSRKALDAIVKRRSSYQKRLDALGEE
jgi:hypothetical protein